MANNEYYRIDDEDRENRLTLVVETGDSVNKYNGPDGEHEYSHDQIRVVERFMDKVYTTRNKIFSGAGAQELAHAAAEQRGDKFFVAILHLVFILHCLILEDDGHRYVSGCTCRSSIHC